jgi:hypothetical protein
MVHTQSDITRSAEVLAKAEGITEKEDQPLSHMIKRHMRDYKE